MNKLIICFFILLASFVLVGVSLAQGGYDLYPPYFCPPIQSSFDRHLLPDKDFFLDSYPLLDTKVSTIITSPGYKFDPGILFILKTQNCDPGILFHLNKRDLDIDPGILVPFHYMEGMGQPEFIYPSPQHDFNLPLQPNLWQNFNLLKPNHFYSPEFDLDILSPNEKFDSEIHRSLPFPQRNCTH